MPTAVENFPSRSARRLRAALVVSLLLGAGFGVARWWPSLDTQDRRDEGILDDEAATDLPREPPTDDPRQALRDRVDASAGVSLLPDPLAEGQIIPARGGGALIVHRAVSSERACPWSVSYLSADALALGFDLGHFAPTPCPSLAGGELSPDIDVQSAPDGSVLALREDDGRTSLWYARTTDSCEWVALATTELNTEPSWAPSRSAEEPTLALFISSRAWQTHWTLWTIPSAPARRDELTLLAAFARTRLRAPTFIDRQHPAVLAHDLSSIGAEIHHRLSIADTSRPGLLLSLPAALFTDEQSRLRDLAVLSPAREGAGPRLLVSAELEGTLRLFSLEIHPRAWASFLQRASRQANEDWSDATLGVRNHVITLARADVDTRLLLESDSLLTFVARPGPDPAVLYTRDLPGAPAAIEIVDLDGTTRRLSDDALPHRQLRPSTTGAYLFFATEVGDVLVPRALELDH